MFDNNSNNKEIFQALLLFLRLQSEAIKVGLHYNSEKIELMKFDIAHDAELFDRTTASKDCLKLKVSWKFDDSVQPGFRSAESTCIVCW